MSDRRSAETRVLIVATGSHGDVLPFIAIGRALLARGFEVMIFAVAPFESSAREAGLGFSALGSQAEYEAALRNPRLNHPTGVLKIMADTLDRHGDAAYAQIAAAVLPGRTLVIASTLGFIARSVAEKYALPVVMVHLAPVILRSAYRVSRHSDGPGLGWRLPAWMARLTYFLVDHLIIGPTLGAAVNRHRRRQSLPPLKRLMHRWINATDPVIGMFPDWFADPQRDWPDHLHLTDFPLYDHGHDAPLSDELAAFLAAGPAPVAFTAGTATAAARSFFAESVEACRRSGRRGLMLTRFPVQLTEQLPPGILAVGYVPFGALLPRVAALVHHGGICTISQAMRAGIPQLIRPMAHDQFDNAVRVSELGVGKEISIKHYRAERVIAELDDLIDNPLFRSKCRELAARLSGDGIEMTCDLIEERIIRFENGHDCPD